MWFCGLCSVVSVQPRTTSPLVFLALALNQGDDCNGIESSIQSKCGCGCGYVWAGARVHRIAYSHHECPCHLLCSLPCPPLHNILLVELAAAHWLRCAAAMRSPTHTVSTALGCASHGCSLLLLPRFPDSRLRAALRLLAALRPAMRPPSRHPHLVFVCVCMCLHISIIHVISSHVFR